MAVRNEVWRLEKIGDTYSLFLLRAKAKYITELTLREVRALAPIADLAGRRPPGLTTSVGMETKVEVQKYE